MSYIIQYLLYKNLKMNQHILKLIYINKCHYQIKMNIINFQYLF